MIKKKQETNNKRVRTTTNKDEEEWVPEEEEEKKMKPKKRFRSNFLSSDLDCFKDNCRELIQSTCQIRLKDLHILFNSNEELKRLLNKYQFSSLKTKMRTERNAYLNSL